MNSQCLACPRITAVLRKRREEHSGNHSPHLSPHLWIARGKDTIVIHGNPSSSSYATHSFTPFLTPRLEGSVVPLRFASFRPVRPGTGSGAFGFTGSIILPLLTSTHDVSCGESYNTIWEHPQHLSHHNIATDPTSAQTHNMTLLLLHSRYMTYSGAFTACLS